jgi:hypothetical protein
MQFFRVCLFIYLTYCFYPSLASVSLLYGIDIYFDIYFHHVIFQILVYYYIFFVLSIFFFIKFFFLSLVLGF